jgi:cyclopropane fatty-acyl-phospholipid synthase-like methyltransferase
MTFEEGSVTNYERILEYVMGMGPFERVLDVGCHGGEA